MNTTKGKEVAAVTALYIYRQNAKLPVHRTMYKVSRTMAAKERQSNRHLLIKFLANQCPEEAQPDLASTPA